MPNKVEIKMKKRIFTATMMAALMTMAAVPASSLSQQDRDGDRVRAHGTVVAYPWALDKATDTAQKSVHRVAAEIARKGGFEVVPGDTASSEWRRTDRRLPTIDHPSKLETLMEYGQAVHANYVLYGSVSWHTRSIWVNAGPKTISTATVNVYVLDVATGSNVYEKHDVEGRSDEKDAAIKIAGDILLTPLVSAVSGGPAAPREERAVQIALSRALYDWVHPIRR